MSELTTETMQVEKVWDKDSYNKIRKMFAPQLTNQEFGMFVGLGKSLGANPFLREIWAVKYGNSEAQIFLGRDFYRRKAQEEPDYKGHQVDAIYSNDEFKMSGGKPEHSYSLQDRGKLIGAYCVVYRSNNEPYFNTVRFDEYFAGGHNKPNLWDKKPETMIKKVAEAQALRGAFQGVFAGTYDQSEEWIDEEIEQNPSQYAPLPEEVEPLRNRYPFDKTLKCPKDSHKPYLNDGSDELDKVEQDVVDGILDPRYVRYFYTVTNSVWDYLAEIPQRIAEMENEDRQVL
jgi:phage recombination protein Bet